MFEESTEETVEEVHTSIFDEPEVKKEIETKETEEVEETESVDLQSVETLYNYWKEFLPFDETDKPTLEFIKEQQELIPQKLFMSYVESRPEHVQDFLDYQSKFPNPTVEELRNFWTQYIDVKEVEVSTTEEARQFLKSRPEFTKLYKSESRIEQALDILEDENEIIDRAKELVEEDKVSKSESKKAELARVEKENQARIVREKEFAKQVNVQIESFPWKSEKKAAIASSLTPKFISNIWSKVSQDPKALPQLIDFFKQYKEGEGFDAFYNLLEGKEKSKEVTKTKSNIEKDSLGKLLGGQKTSGNAKVRSLAEDFG